MVRVAPNLHYAKPNGKCCGAIPRVDVIHLHHGVWLSNGAAGRGRGQRLRRASTRSWPRARRRRSPASRTATATRSAPSDTWVLNYMIHNLTAKAAKVYITYDIDFVPLTRPGIAAGSRRCIRSGWMSRTTTSIPVFNVKRYSGKNGKFTFPDMAKNPYGSAAAAERVHRRPSRHADRDRRAPASGRPLRRP